MWPVKYFSSFSSFVTFAFHSQIYNSFPSCHISITSTYTPSHWLLVVINDVYVHCASKHVTRGITITEVDAMNSVDTLIGD